MNTIDTKPQIGVSACLLGQNVRFDGGHKKNRLIVEEFSQHFDLFPTCPEAELGLGTPRPVIQLRKFDNEVKLVFSKSPDIKITEPMQAFAHKRIRDFHSLNGFVFKKGSPSCGVERVAVTDHVTGHRSYDGTGIFAQTLMQLRPDIPVEEEGRLNDIHLRENFYERVFAHYRWQQIENADTNLHAFREFHKNYKLILMAKSTVACRELGQMVASANKQNLPEVRRKYFLQFMQIMARVPSRGQHVNVLMHIMGYLKDKLNPKDKSELLAWFESYRQQAVTRVTPLVLLQHHFSNHPNEYIAEQYYLSAFPVELMHPA